MKSKILFRCGDDLRDRINSEAIEQGITQHEWLVNACKEALEKQETPRRLPCSKLFDGQSYKRSL